MNRKRIILIIANLIVVLILAVVWQFAAPNNMMALLFPPNLERDVDLRILFIGNSFTSYNNLPDLSRQILLDMPEYDDVTVAMVAPGGYQIVRHTYDVFDTESDTLLRSYLINGSPEIRDWDAVVVQGQSQVMGFANNQTIKANLLDALPQLGGAIQDNDSTLMLMMTWGYAFGDSSNPERYSDFVAMSESLRWGYYDARFQLSEQGIDAYVAPAGLGWRAVYDDLIAKGENPFAEGSYFHRLYAEDNIHPRLGGSYLAANIFVASYTGKSVIDNAYLPQGLDADYATYLREIAESVVFGEVSAGRVYPWNS